MCMYIHRCHWTKKIKSIGFYQGQTKGQLPGVPTCKGHYSVTGIIRNMVLANWGFHTQMNFSQNYPQFGHALSRGFTNPVLRWTSVLRGTKWIACLGHHIINLPRMSICCRLALAIVYKNYDKYLLKNKLYNIFRSKATGRQREENISWMYPWNMLIQSMVCPILKQMV